MGLKLQKLADIINAGIELLRGAKAVGGPDEGHPCQICRLHVPLGVADVGAAGDAVLLHQYFQGLTLAAVGVAEAQVTLKALAKPQLADAQLRVALLAVADDEEAVLFRQGPDSLSHPG